MNPPALGGGWGETILRFLRIVARIDSVPGTAMRVVGFRCWRNGRQVNRDNPP